MEPLSFGLFFLGVLATLLNNSCIEGWIIRFCRAYVLYLFIILASQISQKLPFKPKEQHLRP